MMKQIPKRGFSLIELLLAIFILGIGIISIATLFPAGIAQQQKTTDDIIGPIVARNALTLLRSRIEQEDFSGAEDFEQFWSPALCGFSINQENVNDWPTICGDWMWRRPAIVPTFYGDEGEYSSLSVRGAIDIFATPDTEVIEGHGAPIIQYWTPNSNNTTPGIPFNKEKYPDIPVYKPDPPEPGQEPSGYTLQVPRKLITAAERQYPMWSGAPGDRPKAQYYWDCMFRRYEGRVLVAVFVYRVVDPATDGPYTIETRGLTSPNFPLSTNLATAPNIGSWGATPGDDLLYSDIAPDQYVDPRVQDGMWQYPGQWLVDQNGNVHRVQRGRRRPSNTNPVLLNARPSELSVYESIEYPGTPGVNVNWWDQNETPVFPSGFVDEGVVTDIWYIPTLDEKNRKLIPVFATVEAL